MATMTKAPRTNWWLWGGIAAAVVAVGVAVYALYPFDDGVSPTEPAVTAPAAEDAAPAASE